MIPLLVRRYVAGESLRSLCLWLDAEQVRTVDGNGWRTSTLRNLLSSGRIAGLREHRGQVVGLAVWPAIITPDDRQRVVARMAASQMAARRAPRRYLLSGLLRCARCSGTLFASPRVNTRRYVCLSGPDDGGCGKMSVTAEPLERLVSDAVLYRLDTPALADALAGRAAAAAQAAELADNLAADRSQLAELAGLYGRTAITATEWLIARRAIADRVHDAERRLSAATGTEALVGLAHGDSLHAQWATLNLSRQAAIVRAVLDHAVITPGSRGAQRLDPGRVVPVWRI